MSDDADIVKRLSECADQLQDAQYKQMREHITRQAAEIARLRAALATARREGMEKAAKIGDRHIEIGEVLSETEADKRLADNIKMQVGAMKQVVGAIRGAAKEDRQP